MTKEKLSWLQQKMLNKSIKKKCQNFRELGYSSINEEDLLTYLLTYRSEKTNPFICQRLSQRHSEG